MNMDSMYKIEEMCCRELDKIAQRGELSSSNLQQAAMLVDTVKDIETVAAMAEEDPEYSQYGGSYDNGVAYANRGRHYVRAHYSRDGYPRTGNGQGMGNTGGGGSSYGRDSRGRYSRDGDKEDMIQRLERMMDQSDDPNETAAYKRAMEQLRNA